MRRTGRSLDYFNERVIGIVAVFLSTVFGLVFLRSKTSARVAKKSDDILELFAQASNASAKFLDQEFRSTKVSFYTLLGFRTIANILFIYFISSREANGLGSEFIGVYLGLIVIDQLFNVFLIGKRETFGNLLNERFPGLLKAEVERMQLSRTPRDNSAKVFSEPFRTATLFAGGQLLSLYTKENLLSIFAIVAGLAFVHYGLAIVYVGFVALFLVTISRLSSKTSSIKAMAEEKEALMDKWMLETELLAKSGFSSQDVQPVYRSVSSAINHLSKNENAIHAMVAPGGDDTPRSRRFGRTAFFDASRLPWARKLFFPS